MEEIKVNEYGRTKEGYIFKIININDFRPPESKYCVEANYFNDVLFLGDEDIVKHSPNIIDLIEEGDYVNGAEVIWVSKHYVHCNERDTIDYTQDEIKSIVTKEMFKSVEYRVE